MLTASLFHVGSEAPLACFRPSEEKLAAARLLFFEALAAYSLPRPG